MSHKIRLAVLALFFALCATPLLAQAATVDPLLQFAMLLVPAISYALVQVIGYVAKTLPPRAVPFLHAIIGALVTPLLSLVGVEGLNPFVGLLLGAIASAFDQFVQPTPQIQMTRGMDATPQRVYRS